MSYEFVCPKKEFKKKEISKAQVFFRNGDYFELSGSEIVDINLQFYDTLIANEKGFSPVVKSGYIKCKFDKLAPRYDSSLLYNLKEYKKDRKTYLEERCVNEGGLYYIRLFNRNNWHDGIFGDIVAYKDGDIVILSFQANRTYGTADKEYHTVMAPNVTKQVVEKIDLDFENCDSFEIFQEEILDMQINCKKQLGWSSSSYGREISNGFIRLKLNKELEWRRVNVYDSNEKIPNIKKLERRICGDGEDEIDICHLYVTYRYAGYCKNYEECIDINDIRSMEEIPDIDEEDVNPCFISGYAKKENDGSILIVFGKKKEN